MENETHINNQINNQSQENNQSTNQIKRQKNKEKVSLAEKFPDLLKEWDYERNKFIDPRLIAAHSGAKVYWKCRNNPNHIWCIEVKNRTKKNGSGCPYCNGNRGVKQGVNDLACMFPELAKEWHPTLNGDLKPENVRGHSSKYAYWQCSKNPEHTWKAVINSRANGSGCPLCAKEQRKGKQNANKNLDVDNICELYQVGLSVKEIAEYYEVTPPTIRSRLKAADVYETSNQTSNQ